MSVIYLDLGCSDGKTVKDFLQTNSFCQEHAAVCKKVYAFDPIRHGDWGAIEREFPQVEFIEACAGIREGRSWLSMNANPEARTIVQSNKNYEDEPIRQLVKVLDFTTWFRDNIRFEDTVIMKVDIEGAEYDILEVMIKNKSIIRVDHLFVEFHGWLLPEGYKDREQWIRENCPIKIGEWL